MKDAENLIIKSQLNYHGNIKYIKET